MKKNLDFTQDWLICGTQAQAECAECDDGFWESLIVCWLGPELELKKGVI